MGDSFSRSFHFFLFGRICCDLRRSVAKLPKRKATTAKPIDFPTDWTISLSRILHQFKETNLARERLIIINRSSAFVGVHLPEKKPKSNSFGQIFHRWTEYNKTPLTKD